MSSSCTSLAIPKSVILHTSSSPTNTFRAARSRWIILRQKKMLIYYWLSSLWKTLTSIALPVQTRQISGATNVARIWRLLAIISFVNNNTSWVNPELSHLNLRFELVQQTAGSKFQKRMQVTFFMERYSIPSLISQANFKSCFEVSVERGLTKGSSL